MLTREESRTLGLESKAKQGLTWGQVGEAIGRSPVYAAMLVYGYGQATAAEVKGLLKALSLPEEAEPVLMRTPHRTPAQPCRRPITSRCGCARPRKLPPGIAEPAVVHSTRPA